MDEEDMRIEIGAYRQLFQGDTEYLPATHKQLGYLISLLEEINADRAWMIGVLRQITGLPLTSRRQMTRFTVSVLINQLRDEDGKLSDSGRTFLQALGQTASVYT